MNYPRFTKPDKQTLKLVQGRDIEFQKRRRSLLRTRSEVEACIIANLICTPRDAATHRRSLKPVAVAALKVKVMSATAFVREEER